MPPKTIQVPPRENFLEASLGDRMKFYEDASRYYLKSEVGDSLILRFDGRSFSTFTENFIKPLDDVLLSCMQQAMSAVVLEVQGAYFGYCQSDEITVICRPKKGDLEQLPFKGNVQKICSVYASIVSTTFNLALLEHRNADLTNKKFYKGEKPKLAQFDARCWLLPQAELINAVIFRQLDCERNSISGLAQEIFSHKQLHGQNTAQKLEMLQAQGYDWHGWPNHHKYGLITYKESYDKKDEFGQPVIRHRWTLDYDAPKIVTNRSYFENI